MQTIRDVLEHKGGEVVTISPQATVRTAIEELCGRKIGSLLVRDDENHVVGILTERDVLRIVRDHSQRLDTAPVSEFMTRDVVCCVPEDNVGYAMSVMTKNRFRRMPVVEAGRLAGIISIGDLVNSVHSEQEVELRMMKDMMAGGPGHAEAKAG